MALQVVSTPAINTRAAIPEHDAVVDRLALDLGVQQLAQQVVARVLAPVLELVDEEVEEALGTLLAPLGIVGELEHVAHPPGEGVGHVGWARRGCGR